MDSRTKSQICKDIEDLAKTKKEVPKLYLTSMTRDGLLSLEQMIRKFPDKASESRKEDTKPAAPAADTSAPHGAGTTKGHEVSEEKEPKRIIKLNPEILRILSFTDALDYIERRGYSVSVEQRESDSPKGEILDAHVDDTDKVKLIVSKGPKKKEEPVVKEKETADKVEPKDKKESKEEKSSKAHPVLDWLKDWFVNH